VLVLILAIFIASHVRRTTKLDEERGESNQRQPKKSSCPSKADNNVELPVILSQKSTREDFDGASNNSRANVKNTMLYENKTVDNGDQDDH